VQAKLTYAGEQCYDGLVSANRQMTFFVTEFGVRSNLF